MIAYPPRKWVSVYELPVNDLGGFLHDGFADWIPPFNDLVYILELAREGPGFFDIGFILVNERKIIRSLVLCQKRRDHLLCELEPNNSLVRS